MCFNSVLVSNGFRSSASKETRRMGICRCTLCPSEYTRYTGIISWRVRKRHGHSKFMEMHPRPVWTVTLEKTHFQPLQNWRARRAFWLGFVTDEFKADCGLNRSWILATATGEIAHGFSDISNETDFPVWKLRGKRDKRRGKPRHGVHFIRASFLAPGCIYFLPLHH